ncbi:MAG: membrane protein YqaA with SNARE-associated domain [Paracoccaceae bacterium]|jgi:membrane protein YqaA with SNARE-associated domain
MLRRLYDWVIAQASKPWALAWLIAISFIESSVFPIPPDVLMIPMIIAAPRRAWLIAGVCTLASVAGGGFGWFIGAHLFDAIGLPVLEFYGKADAFDTLAASYNEQGFWAVLVAGVTPFPYKVITIFSGATGLDFWLFMATSLLARSLRFFLIAALLWKYGEPIRDFIDRRFGLVATVAIVLLIGGFAVVKWLV